MQPRGEGCFLQTLNIGCVIVLMIFAVIGIMVIIFLAMFF